MILAYLFELMLFNLHVFLFFTYSWSTRGPLADHPRQQGELPNFQLLGRLAEEARFLDSHSATGTLATRKRIVSTLASHATGTPTTRPMKMGG